MTVTSAATSAAREVTTNPNGEFQFSQLAPGKYDLTVTAQGFEKVEKKGMDLLVGQPATFNVSLGVGSVTADVVVTTETEPVLNTTDATMGNAFDARAGGATADRRQKCSGPVEPAAGRDVSRANGRSERHQRDRQQRQRLAFGSSVNGGRSDQSNITLDGVDVNDINNGYAFTSVLRVTQDSVAEFRVTTSNPNADEGRSSGAQVALVTRSGTNQYHGAVYEYNRSNFLEANDFFNKQQQLAAGEANKPPKLIRNVFGVALGGPIKKDRVFLFMNYEGRRDDEGVSVNAGTVPTAAFRGGNLQYQYVNSSGPDAIYELTPADHPGNGSAGDWRQPGDALAAEPVPDAQRSRRRAME